MRRRGGARARAGDARAESASAGVQDEAWRWLERLQVQDAPRDAPRSRGVVATPHAVAARIAAALVGDVQRGAGLRLLDAGCGDGRLAAAVVRAGAARALRLDCVGVDLDARAARRAQELEARLRAAAGAGLGTWTMTSADFLRLPVVPAYDLAIANPPYVAVRGLEPGMRRRLRASGPGRRDLAVIFVERLLAMLRPGGRLAVIVPGALLAARHAAPLRDLLLRDATLEAVHDLSGQRVFAGVGAYPVILVAARRVPGPRHTIAVSDAGARLRARWPAAVLRELPDRVLPLGCDAELLPLVHRLTRGPRLADAVRVRCGIATAGFGGAVGRGPDRILRSGDVRAFRVAAPARFDAARAGVPRAVRERLQVPKLVVPGMFRRLCAAWDGHGSLLGRVYWIAPPDGIRADAHDAWRALLLALLNARLYAILYRALFAGVAQSGGWLRLNAPYLGALPWPEHPATRDLVDIVERLESWPRPSDRRRLDDWVEDIFGLRPEERALLDRLEADPRESIEAGSEPIGPPRRARGRPQLASTA